MIWNEFAFDLVRQHVDDAILVSEEEIAQAMVYALQVEKVVVEGGGNVEMANLFWLDAEAERAS